MATLHFEIGKEYTLTKTFAESDVYLFAGIIGDLFPAHVNEEYSLAFLPGNFTPNGWEHCRMRWTLSKTATVSPGPPMAASRKPFSANCTPSPSA